MSKRSTGRVNRWARTWGIFTCFSDKVTQGMRNTAASTGRFMEVPVVQIYTVEDYFTGRVPTLPRVA